MILEVILKKTFYMGLTILIHENEYMKDHNLELWKKI